MVKATTLLSPKLRRVRDFLHVEGRDHQRSVVRDALVSGTGDPMTMRPPWGSPLKGPWSRENVVPEDEVQGVEEEE